MLHILISAHVEYYDICACVTISVIALAEAQRILRGVSPRRVRVSHPPVSSVDLIEEPVTANKIVR